MQQKQMLHREEAGHMGQVIHPHFLHHSSVHLLIQHLTLVHFYTKEKDVNIMLLLKHMWLYVNSVTLVNIIIYTSPSF